MVALVMASKVSGEAVSGLLARGEESNVATDDSDMEAESSDQPARDGRLARLANDSLPAEVKEAVVSVDLPSLVTSPHADSLSIPFQSGMRSVCQA